MNVETEAEYLQIVASMKPTGWIVVWGLLQTDRPVRRRDLLRGIERQVAAFERDPDEAVRGVLRRLHRAGLVEYSRRPGAPAGKGHRGAWKLSPEARSAFRKSGDPDSVIRAWRSLVKP